MVLHDWRRQQNLTKEEAGRLIGVSGVSIGRYENGRVPDTATIRLIIAATKGAVTANDFFGLIGGDTSPAYRSGQRGRKYGAHKAVYRRRKVKA